MDRGDLRARIERELDERGRHQVLNTDASAASDLYDAAAYDLERLLGINIKTAQLEVFATDGEYLVTATIERIRFRCFFAYSSKGSGYSSTRPWQAWKSTSKWPWRREGHWIDIRNLIDLKQVI